MKFSVSLKKNSDFRRLYAKGKSVATPRFVLYARKNGREINRLGITASTKLGNAVVRNRLRRRLREVYRLCEADLIPGFDLIIVARGAALAAPFVRLCGDMRSLAGRLGALGVEREKP
ncbi:MAG: ribonuclease P protein component [Oscillospiraceae bacterium]|jgi:ribonuclease P protein component|nr:ribonuclease P protein component [Oscillospiraceae bacterium]